MTRSLALLLPCTLSAVAAEPVAIKIPDRPLHDGLIRPTLFGNFVELLDDLVPGMRAEMLNDRGFEGVIPAANWVYYDGGPTLCDRPWDRSDDWSIERTGAFNGARCAHMTVPAGRAVELSQSGLAVRAGETYRF